MSYPDVGTGHRLAEAAAENCTARDLNLCDVQYSSMIRPFLLNIWLFSMLCYLVILSSS
jgi:hypothetical protein